MSNGFRIFLLILLVFASIWLYRLREPFLDRLVSPYRTFAGDIAMHESSDKVVGLMRERPRINELLPSVELGALGSQAWDSKGRWRGVQLPPSSADEQAVQPIDPAMGEGVEWGDVFPEFGSSAETGHEAFDPIVGDPVDRDLLPGANSEGQLSPLTSVANGFDSRSEHQSEEKPAQSSGESGQDGASKSFDVTVYTVEEGDTLWKIAQKVLGKASRCNEIHAANRDALPNLNRLRVGMKLKVRVPKEKKNVPSQNPLKIDSLPSDTTVKPVSAREREPVSKRTHRVAADETLSKIAGKYFSGDSRGVTVIYEANRDQLSSPHDIREGQKLVIPSPTATGR